LRFALVSVNSAEWSEIQAAQLPPDRERQTLDALRHPVEADRMGGSMSRNPNHGRRDVRGRAITETIRVSSSESVPEGYSRIALPSPAIFAKAQVLSARHLKPIFVEVDATDPARRAGYWIHESIRPELAEWLKSRIFTEPDLFDTE
jgi:hypothetical protein